MAKRGLDITVIGGDAGGSDVDKFKATTSRITADASMLKARTEYAEAINAARKGASDEDNAVYDKIEAFGDKVDPVLAKLGDSNWINGTDEDGNSNLQKVNELLLEVRRKRNLPTFRASGNPKLSGTLLRNLERQLVSASIGGLVEKTLFGGSSPPQLDDYNLENLIVDNPKNPTKIIYQSGSSGRAEMSFAKFKSQIGLKSIRDLAVTFAIENTEARLGQEK